MSSFGSTPVRILSWSTEQLQKSLGTQSSKEKHNYNQNFMTIFNYLYSRLNISLLPSAVMYEQQIMALAKTPFWCAFLSSKNASGLSSCGTEHLCEQGQEGRSWSNRPKLWHEKFQLDRRKIFSRVESAKHWSRCPNEMWSLQQLKYLILILGRLWIIQSDWPCHQHRLGQGSL